MVWSNVMNLVGPPGSNTSTNISTINYLNISTLHFPNTLNKALFNVTIPTNVWVAGFYDPGLNSIKYSRDNRNWSNINSGGFDAYTWGIASGNNMLVATGTNALSKSTIQYSYDAANWFPIKSGGFSASGNAVAYGSNMWVAVGIDGAENNIQHSSNGIYWSIARCFGFSNGYGVAYGSNMWVAVGQGSNTIIYSADGMRWSPAINGFGTGNIGKGVAWGSSMWVAVGDCQTTSNHPTSTIMYSINGSNWSNINSGGFSYTAYGVAYGSNNFGSTMWVAVGSATSATSSIQYSYDASNWSNIATGGFSNGRNVTYNNGIWAAVGNPTGGGASVQYSINGINWSNNTLNNYAVSITNGTAYMDSYISTLSTNLSAFSTISSYDYTSTILSSLTTWVAVGLSGHATGPIEYSYDGIYWMNANYTETPINTTYSVASGSNTVSGSNMLVAVGVDSRGLETCIKYSYNGSNWSNAINTSTIFTSGYGVAYGSNMWVAVGESITNNINSGIQYSPDGVNWYISQLNNLSTINGVAYGSNSSVGSNMWVAVGADTGNVDPNRSIQYSYDASNWTLSSANGFNLGKEVAYGNNMWVAVGGGANYITSTIQYSPDGTSWSMVNSGGFTGSGNGVAYGNNMWVAIGFNYKDSVSSIIKYSYDASNWSNVISDNFYRGNSVSYKNGLWVAVGEVETGYESSIIHSIDGINWSNTNYGGYNRNYGVAAIDSSNIYTRYVSTPVISYFAISTISMYTSTTNSKYDWNINLVDNVITLNNSTTTISFNEDLMTNLSTLAEVSLTELSISTLSFIKPTVINYMSNINENLNSTWVAVNNRVNEIILYSTDTSNWYPANSGAFVGDGRGVGYGNGIWVAVATSVEGPNIKYSYNGSNWYNSIFSNPELINTSYFGVAYGSNMWVAVGTGSTVHSFDAVSWNSLNSGGFSLGRGVAYGSTIWVAVGDATNNVSTTSIKYSIDGSNWSNANSGGFGAWGNSVVYGSTMWVATGQFPVGGLGGPTALPIETIQYSTDGLNWSNANSGGFTIYGNGVAYGNGIWVAVGEYSIDGRSSIQYSYDGSNWSNANCGAIEYGIDVSYNSGMWVTVGSNTGTSTGILYSSDGFNWSNTVYGGYNTNFGVAGGNTVNGTIYISTVNNGYDWNLRVREGLLALNNTIASTTVTFTNTLMTNLSTLTNNNLNLSTLNNLELTNNLMTNFSNIANNNLNLSTLNNISMTSSLITNLSTLAYNSMPLSPSITYISTVGQTITRPQWASFMRITNMGGGGDGGIGGASVSNESLYGSMGGGGGGGGGTIIYKTAINNYSISYVFASTVGNYNASLVTLSNNINVLNLYAFYGSNGVAGSDVTAGAGGNAPTTPGHGPSGSIVIQGINGRSGGIYSVRGSGFLGGAAGADSNGGTGGGGGGMGGGANGGPGGLGSDAFGETPLASTISGGFGSGGGGGGGAGYSNIFTSPAGPGGGPLIIFEWT